MVPLLNQEYLYSTKFREQLAQLGAPDHGKNLIIYIPLSCILGFIVLAILCKTCRKGKVRDIQLGSQPENMVNAFDYSELMIDKEDQRQLKSQQPLDIKERQLLRGPDSSGDDLSNYSYDNGKRIGMSRNSFDSQNSTHLKQLPILQ